MARASIKGVVLGNIVDIVSTNIVVLPVMIYVMATSMSGSPAVHDPSVVAQILRGSTTFLIASNVLGGLCSVLGGYVSARVAKHDEVLNGALSSILCVGGGLYTLTSGSSASPPWLHLIFLPLSPVLGALGGVLRSRSPPVSSA